MTNPKMTNLVHLDHPKKERIYYVSGMHCASCEIIIEKKILDLPGVNAVEASTAREEVLIESSGSLPLKDHLDQMFKKEGYKFSLSPWQKQEGERSPSISSIIMVAIIIIGLFFLLSRLGLGDLVRVDATSSLPIFFFLGLLAGISSCAALVGGIVLSMSKQWAERYSKEDPFTKKFEPHLLFNVGRLISYALLGAVLGMIGNKLQISLGFSFWLVVLVSLLMFVLGLQMLGVPYFQRFQITMPKALTRFAADEAHFKGKILPLVMGALTFFLPCGFTLTAQSLALLSGSGLQGGLIMLFFALGTMPMLLLIGLSSVKFLEKPKFNHLFLKTAGISVLFFAFYNLNNQLNVMGLPSFNDFIAYSSTNTALLTDTKQYNFPPMVDGKQLIKMEASARGYSPNYLVVKAGVPVRWEITDTGTSGCTNAVIAKNLFSGQIDLTPGQTAVKEFTPTTPGKYKFSCWMGMISGVIEVVDPKLSSKAVSPSLKEANFNFSPLNNNNAGGCQAGSTSNSCVSQKNI